jgi:hypothetical protein
MPSRTDTICRFVVVWFGPWPIYFPAFLVTCAPNIRFEWLILSDTPPPPTHPPNVRFAHLTLADFNTRLKQHCRLDFAVPDDAIYKICDFKWSYGQIFDDLLRDVPYWGICDIDQLWGNILGHLTENLFRSHDILTTRQRRFSGHCTIFRNCPLVNTYYNRITGFDEVLREKTECLHFDEEYTTRHFKTLLKQKPKKWWQRPFAPRQPRIYWEKLLVNYGDDHLAMRDDQYIEWRNGRTYTAEGQELMYLHFHRLKATIRSCNFTYGDNPRRIRLSRYEILGD